MSNKTTDGEEQRGLGKVVYSVDSESTQEERQELDHESAEVTEASKESFPASDPPAYTGTAADGQDEGADSSDS